MRSTETPVTAIASGSELFLRFITLATLDIQVRILTLRFCVLHLKINLVSYAEMMQFIYICVF